MGAVCNCHYLLLLKLTECVLVRCDKPTHSSFFSSPLVIIILGLSAYATVVRWCPTTFHLSGDLNKVSRRLNIELHHGHRVAADAEASSYRGHLRVELRPRIKLPWDGRSRKSNWVRIATYGWYQMSLRYSNVRTVTFTWVYVCVGACARSCGRFW